MTVAAIPKIPIPDLNQIRVQDDTPVDSFYTEFQQHLLVESLKSSWPGPGSGRPFIVASNVGVFHAVRKPPVVPDVFLSLDVDLDPERILDDQRSYFVWVFGKVPDLVIEIVSPTLNDEDSDKLRLYESLNIPFYAIYDPGHYLNDEELRVFGIADGAYRRIPTGYIKKLGVGLAVWEGPYHGKTSTWLRWVDANGQVIPTADERAEQEQKRAGKLEEKLANYAAKLRDAGLSLNGD